MGRLLQVSTNYSIRVLTKLIVAVVMAGAAETATFVPQAASYLLVPATPRLCHHSLLFRLLHHRLDCHLLLQAHQHLPSRRSRSRRTARVAKRSHARVQSSATAAANMDTVVARQATAMPGATLSLALARARPYQAPRLLYRRSRCPRMPNVADPRARHARTRLLATAVVNTGGAEVVRHTVAVAAIRRSVTARISVARLRPLVEVLTLHTHLFQQPQQPIQ